MQSTNQAGIDIIKSAESLRLNAYLCPASVWTIGYGHTSGVKRGDVIGAQAAEAFLRQDLATAEAAVNQLVLVHLTSNQFSALVSFVFNVGAANFAKSSLLRKLNAGDRTAVPRELAKWVYDRDAKGKLVKLPGLVTRRARESALWLTGEFIAPSTTNPEQPSWLTKLVVAFRERASQGA